MLGTVPKRVEIMGVPVTTFDSYGHASNCIVDSVRRRQKVSCVAMNPIKVYAAWKDTQLRNVISSADFCICDGIGVAVAMRLLHGRMISRVTGIQLFCDLAACAEESGLRVFLLGAKPESNQKACEKLKALHPRLQVVGRHHGYFSDNDAVIKQINDSCADMLFVAMGSPRQEKWLAEYRDKIDAYYCMGVGGSFDVLSGSARRAPRIFCRTGTEWLYRLVTQPKRLREQIVLPLFALRVLRQFLAASLARPSRVSEGRLLKTRGRPQAGKTHGGRGGDSRVVAADGKTGTNTPFGQESWVRPRRQPSLTKS
jgi:N-acetylglucosaminyldiphosphoundecaprenol N-acetyl-beta-D-mannosaminyltransferase